MAFMGLNLDFGPVLKFVGFTMAVVRGFQQIQLDEKIKQGQSTIDTQPIKLTHSRNP